MKKMRWWVVYALLVGVSAVVGGALGPWAGGRVAHAEAPVQQLVSEIQEALQAWDTVTAASLLEALDPEAAKGIADGLWGRYYLLTGDYAEAAERLRSAVAVQPLPMLLHWMEIAQSTHEVTRNYEETRSESGRFIVAHEPGVDAILVPYALEALESAWGSLTKIFDYEPPTPIRVEIYPTVDVLAQVSPLSVSEIRTSGTIALCKYNRLMITSPRDLVYGYGWLDTLAHELIHLMVTQKSRNQVPIWLHEGLAKYYEVMWRPGVKPRLGRQSEGFLADALKDDALIPFADMSPSMAKLPSQVATATAFAEVWTVIEFLNHQRGKDVAAELVAAMGRGLSDREAVAQVSGIAWGAFEGRWERFLRGQGYRQMETQDRMRLLFKGKDTEQDELANIQIESARDHVWLGDKMRLRKKYKAAIKEYTKATRAVGDDSPLIQGKLGHALVQAGRHEEAVEALRKPLAHHARHVVLHVYLGQALLALERYQEAREHLEEALTMNPFDPDLHGTLASVYEALEMPERAKRERAFSELLK